MNGNIPEKLVYVCAPKRTLNSRWDDSDESIAKVEVSPAYISDAENKKTLASATRWAQRPNYTPETFAYDNNPIRGVKIVGYSHRSEGGGSYNAIVYDKFYVDFRDDVMLDVIINSKIDKGVILDDFIWARVGSNMKLVRVGSWLHGQMVEATAQDATKPIEDLVFGGVYESKSGDTAIFLGSHPNLVSYSLTKESGRAWNNPNPTIKKTDYKTALVFHRVYLNAISKQFEFRPSYHNVDIKKSHSYRKKVGDVIVPLNWKAQIWNELSSSISARAPRTSSWGKKEYGYWRDIAYYSSALSLVKPDHQYLTDLKNYPNLIS